MKTFISYLNESKIQSVMKIDKFNNKFWVIPNTEKNELSFRGHGILHREDGPAMQYADGSKEWWINGLRHREDGPAFISSRGTKEWYINGKTHREDGPAEEQKNGTIYWYLDGKEIQPTLEMMSKYIRLNPDNIFKIYDWPKEIQALAIELGGEKIRVKLMANNKLDPSLINKKLVDLNKRGFFN